MGFKPLINVAVDIGTHKVVCVVTKSTKSVSQSAHLTPSSNNASIEIIGVGISPSLGVRKGNVINIDDLAKSIISAVADAEKMSGVHITAVSVSTSGSHLEGFNSGGMVPVKTKEIRSSDVTSVMEVARAVPLQADREIVHVLAQDFIVDGQEGVKNPVGISGSRLEVKAHIVTGLSTAAHNLIKAVNKAGLSVSDIVASTIGCSLSTVTEEEKECGVCVVDIGAGTTDISILCHGAYQHTVSLPVGGNHVTNDIAIGLRIPIASAEKAKCRHGSATKALVGRNESIEVAGIEPHPARIISKFTLAEIIEARMNEIFQMVRDKINESGYNEIASSGVVLVGGCANLIGVSQLAEQVLKLPVRIGSSVHRKDKKLIGLLDLVSGPEFASAVGMAIHASNGKYEEMDQKSSRFGLNAIKKVGNWVGNHF